MSRWQVNIALVLIGSWFALLDRCVIVSAAMAISPSMVFLPLLQAGIGLCVFLAANGAFPVATEGAGDWRAFRRNAVVFGIPLILFVLSPALISEPTYGERYGYSDKFLINASVAHDLRCCWNPLHQLNFRR